MYDCNDDEYDCDDDDDDCYVAWGVVTATTMVMVMQVEIGGVLNQNY